MPVASVPADLQRFFQVHDSVFECAHVTVQGAQVSQGQGFAGLVTHLAADQQGLLVTGSALGVPAQVLKRVARLLRL